jgi:chitin disaccharide deacetylase
MTRSFVLCADDFAMTEGVSRSILELLAAGRLSAAGAMTNRPHWPRLAAELAAFSDKADLGLHLNLTCASPLAAMPTVAPSGALPKLGAVGPLALRSRRARAEIAAEIARQLDAFEQHLGRPPDFIDGHQHVHVLPGIRRAVIEAMAARYPAGSVYLRDPSDSIQAIRARGVAVGKALTVAGLAAGLRRAANRRGIPTNRGFSGFSPFDARRDFAADLAAFLVRPGPAHLVMCHPGHLDDELLALDPVVATRPLEHAALMAFAPPQGGRIARFADIR